MAFGESGMPNQSCLTHFFMPFVQPSHSPSSRMASSSVSISPECPSFQLKLGIAADNASVVSTKEALSG